MGKQSKYENRMGKCFKDMRVKEVTYHSESRTISGYAAVFNNVDKAGDMLVKGCFAKSIQERGPESDANDKIIMLWMHDMHEPIGRITELIEDDHGLYFEAAIDEVERGEQTIRQLESGTLNQFSIGYSYVWDKCEYDAQRECLLVREVVLYEISVVTIGCNGETEYLGLKSAEDYGDALKELVTETDSALKGMNIRKKEEIQRIINKAMSLAGHKPEEAPLVTPQADEQESKIKLFGTIKLKEND